MIVKVVCSSCLAGTMKFGTWVLCTCSTVMGKAVEMLSAYREYGHGSTGSSSTYRVELAVIFSDRLNEPSVPVVPCTLVGSAPWYRVTDAPATGTVLLESDADAFPASVTVLPDKTGDLGVEVKLMLTVDGIGLTWYCGDIDAA